MKLLVLLVAAVLLSQSTIFARRGNPPIEDRRRQYVVIDSDDDHPRKPTYAFLDTTYGTWTRVTGFSDPDTGYATITSAPASMTFPLGIQNVSLPPHHIMTNGLMIIDQNYPPMITEDHVRLVARSTNRFLNFMPFTTIYPLWTDLELRTNGDSTKVFYRVTQDTFYLSFYNAALRGSNGKIRATFQVVFAKPDSSITFNYRSFDGNVDGEQAAAIFQRHATIGIQDSLGRYSTTYLDRSIYYAHSKAANPAPYEQNLHNGLAVKFIHVPANTLAVRSMTTPSYDGFEMTGSSFQPVVRVTQFTDSAQMIYVFNEVINTITNAKVYSRLDSILVGAAQERGFTGAGVPIPCGSFRMTTTIYCPAIGLDPWTHDNSTVREFVRLTELPFPHIDHYTKVDRCSYKVAGVQFVESAESVMRDPAAPYFTGGIVFDRRNARDLMYRDSSSGGDTLTTSFINLLGKSNMWLMFSYQRGLRQDSLHAGIRSRLLTGPERRVISTDTTLADGGDSLIIEALHSLGSTWNPAENRWVMIGAITGGNDLETNKFRAQIPSSYIHNHSRFRIRLAAKRHGPFLGFPFDDNDAYVVDGLQIVQPTISKTSTDLEPTGITLGAKYYNHIPRDVKLIKPRVKIASNGMQAVQAVYQVKLILRDQLGREVYNKRQSLVAPLPRTDVELEMPEWPIEGSQGGVFTAKVMIEQMFSDYLAANDTNTFYRTLEIDDMYAFDDGEPDTVGTTTAITTPFFYTFRPLRTDSLRGMEFYHLNATGQTNWVLTFRNPANVTRYVRSLTYDVLERGFKRALFSSPVPLSVDSTYVIECRMTQGFGLGGDASNGLVIRDTAAVTSHFVFLHQDVVGDFADTSGQFANVTAPKNAAAGGPIVPMLHLVYRGSSTFLPVELLTMKARRTGDDVAIEFSTASESNVREFSIERSAFGQPWDQVTSLAAKNAMHGAPYTSLDLHAPQCEIQYRLIAHDLDGSAQVVATVAVGPSSASGNAIMIRPNPASSYAQLTLPAVAPTMYGAIYDAAGRTVRTFILENTTQPAIDVLGLSDGMYVVEIVIGSERYRAKLWISQ